MVSGLFGSTWERQSEIGGSGQMVSRGSQRAASVASGAPFRSAGDTGSPVSLRRN
jgi:hypothetical protein